MNNLVDFAYEIIAMKNRIEFLEGEVERLEGYERKYVDLLNSSIAHSDKMMSNMLDLLTHADLRSIEVTQI